MRTVFNVLIIVSSIVILKPVRFGSIRQIRPDLQKKGPCRHGPFDTDSNYGWQGHPI
jgi:hypothetical protein